MEKERQEGVYRVIRETAYGEIAEKKSRFLAALTPVESEEEALAFVDCVRRKYYDARHNCYAYLLRDPELERWSDDGEPGGTAGRPMLEVLRGAGLTNAVVVVTRYFGGTLLGTGGLVRAYTQAVQQALADCRIVTMRRGNRYTVTADYGLTGKLQYLFAARRMKVEETVYTEQVRFCILAPEETEGKLEKELTDITGGKARVELLGEDWYEEEV